MLLSLVHLIVIITVTYAYVPLEDREGYTTCSVIDYMAGTDTRLYNCSGIITLYQDYLSNSEEVPEYIVYPKHSAINGGITGCTTFDDSPLSSVSDSTENFNKQRNVYVYGTQTYTQRAAGVFLNLVTGFIEWASSHVESFKHMGPVCGTKDQLVRHNGYGYILRISIENNNIRGSDCDPTSQQEKIAGAIEEWIQGHGHLCGTWCMDLSHSGDWEGYISLGTGKNSIDVENCRNVFTWGSECTQVSNNGYTDK